MLSYQHAYHAGHAADVVKHALLAALFQRLTQKDAALVYLESHAGRGLYPLDAPETRKTLPHESGILRVLPGLPTAPEALQPYGTLFPADEPLLTYPGSPVVAKTLLRAQDLIHVCEAHPGEVVHLRQAVKGDARIKVHKADGHQTLPTLLPVASGRALALIDPSYEVKEEYLQTAATVTAILEKAAKTIVMVWYPLLPAARHLAMVEALQNLQVPATWQAEYVWDVAARQNEKGMFGTGFVVLNLPYQLENVFAQALTWLAPRLATPRQFADGRILPGTFALQHGFLGSA